jgi:hypothetical protein
VSLPKQSYLFNATHSTTSNMAVRQLPTRHDYLHLETKYGNRYACDVRTCSARWTPEQGSELYMEGNEVTSNVRKEKRYMEAK